MSSHLFTFVCEFQGGTYISQVEADDEQSAIREWASALLNAREMGALSYRLSMWAAAQNSPPEQVSGLDHVWCLTGLIGDELVVTHIMRTR